MKAAKSNMALFPRAMLPRLLALLSLAGTLSACDPGIRIGVAMRGVDTHQLATRLRPGQSTRSELSAAFGTPDTMGVVMLPGQDRPREAWSYERQSITVQRWVSLFGPAQTLPNELFRLTLFWSGDILDGYLWYDSTGERLRSPG
jgi:hypothetical protein